MEAEGAEESRAAIADDIDGENARKGGEREPEGDLGSVREDNDNVSFL